MINSIIIDILISSDKCIKSKESNVTNCFTYDLFLNNIINIIILHVKNYVLPMNNQIVQSMSNYFVCTSFLYL